MKIIDELKKTRSANNSIDIIKKTHYNSILNRIKFINSYGKTTMVYTVPLFLPSFPVYDINIIVNYLLNKLKRDGFRVERIKEYELCIAW